MAIKGTPMRKKYNDIYTGEYLNRVAFPMGGMGAGMICLEGTGTLSHFSLRNAPDVYPSGTHLEQTVLALSRERVRRAEIGLAHLRRYYPEARTSELGAEGLAVPEV